jgi:hypothetical protein
MMLHEIETGVPMPPTRAIQSTVYPFAKLTKVGMSFFVPDSDVAGHVLQRRVASRAVWHSKARNWKFAIRRVEGGVRVWRTA